MSGLDDCYNIFDMREVANGREDSIRACDGRDDPNGGDRRDGFGSVVDAALCLA